MKYDQIVIGLGAMGSATTYQLAKRGHKVLGIDQFEPPHRLGSSHGDSRITRQAIAESPEYTPLVLRANEIWREIEQETGANLLTTTGMLLMVSNTDRTKNKFLNNTILAAKKYGIPHEILNTEDIRKRFPQFGFKGDEEGYYEPGAGFLRPEACIEAQLTLALRCGAELHANEKLTSYSEQDGVITIKTAKGEYQTERLILTTGSWISEFLPEKHRANFKVYRQVLYWFEVNQDSDQFRPDKFPVFNWEFNSADEDFLYGFPLMDGSNVMKIASEQYDVSTDPEEVDRDVSEDEIKHMYNVYVKENLPFLSSKCVDARACLYTVTPDHKFVIDYHPTNKNIIFASPCSGHGFKHSAAIGELLADMATDQKTKIDISSFALERLDQV